MNDKKNFRPITDGEIIEEMTENDTVLIERNGEVKRTKGVIGGGRSTAYIRYRQDPYWIGSGEYDFVNAEDLSVIEPATHDAVQQAMKNGIVYVVTGEPHSYNFQLSQIIQCCGNSYSTYFFGGCGAGIDSFTIEEN